MTFQSDVDVLRDQSSELSVESEQTGLYLYAIVAVAGDADPAHISRLASESLPDTESGRAVSAFQVLEHDGIAAVVEPVGLSDFTEEAIRSRLDDPDWLHQVVRRHHTVIQSLHQQFAVIPARFGSVYATDDDLKAALIERHSNLVSLLESLDGCAEWVVHLYAEPEALHELALSEDPTLDSVRAELESAGPGRAYLLQRKMTEQSTEALRRLETRLAEDVVVSLRDHAVDYSVDAVGQQPQADGTEVEIVQASFLVHRDSIDVFLAASEQIGDQQPFWRLECTGPWPPYSFAALEQDAQL